MTYLPGQQQGQNLGAQGQNEQRPDPRAYQYRPIAPNVRVDPPITNAPTFGQYVRSDTRGIPGSKNRVRWPGAVAFWMGLVAIALLWVVAGIASIAAFASVAAAFSVVAIFFGLVSWVTGAGRGLAFWGILFALAGNIYVIQFLLSLFNS